MSLLSLVSPCSNWNWNWSLFMVIMTAQLSSFYPSFNNPVNMLTVHQWIGQSSYKYNNLEKRKYELKLSTSFRSCWSISLCYLDNKLQCNNHSQRWTWVMLFLFSFCPICYMCNAAYHFYTIGKWLYFLSLYNMCIFGFPLPLKIVKK